MDLDNSLHSEHSYQSRHSYVDFDGDDGNSKMGFRNTNRDSRPGHTADKLARMFHKKQTLKDSFLGSEAMRATSNSMALVNSVLGFDIVELWCQDIDNSFTCTYVHASEEVSIYPIISGHYPGKSKDHKHSPLLCQMTKDNSTRYHWKIADKAPNPGNHRSTLNSDILAPLVTEMCCWLEGDFGGANVFIIGFALAKIEYKLSKIKFLNGIGCAIYVAAFDLYDDGYDEDNAQAAELDKKAFVPRMSSYASFANLQTDGSPASSWKNLHSSAYNLASLPQTEYMDLAETDGQPPQAKMFLHHMHTAILSGGGDRIRTNSYASVESGNGTHGLGQQDITTPIISRKSAEFASSDTLHMDGIDSPTSDASSGTGTEQPMMRKVISSEKPIFSDPAFNDLAISSKTVVISSADVQVPGYQQGQSQMSWEPLDTFSFPISHLAVTNIVPDNLSMENFKDIKHIADGSNAHVFLGRYNGEKVIIKMIKEKVMHDSVALHEFEVEYSVLSRISHPHIIKLLGAGSVPRRFVVLEHLSGGTLQSVLSMHQQKPGLANKLFRKPSFTYANLLSKAIDMANALLYLHQSCNDRAMIIHRDLKPDNVGFTSDGSLKLFDFGLCTCVRKRSTDDEAFEMTGNTGSLRYMAPEVALRKPYNEKADVYSFGIMLWQMARDRTPFKGMNKEEFLRLVVLRGERPKLDKAWPAAFSNLITSCWSSDPTFRPTFSQLIEQLTKLSNEINNKFWPNKQKGRGINIGGTPSGENASPPSSTWF